MKSSEDGTIVFSKKQTDSDYAGSATRKLFVGAARLENELLRGNDISCGASPRDAEHERVYRLASRKLRVLKTFRLAAKSNPHRSSISQQAAPKTTCDSGGNGADKIGHATPTCYQMRHSFQGKALGLTRKDIKGLPYLDPTALHT